MTDGSPQLPSIRQLGHSTTPFTMGMGLDFVVYLSLGVSTRSFLIYRDGPLYNNKRVTRVPPHRTLVLGGTYQVIEF
ncbi:uncharacterized protein BJX67DRAFT_363764 [Aspergillus lucknowensis]|uniref:Uncharacterized protein n=1 Tax=Aspergillus lucknowensis TaxID=176173 RepID=A0ABR4LG37_9EURO